MRQKPYVRPYCLNWKHGDFHFYAKILESGFLPYFRISCYITRNLSCVGSSGMSPQPAGPQSLGFLQRNGRQIPQNDRLSLLVGFNSKKNVNYWKSLGLILQIRVWCSASHLEQPERMNRRVKVYSKIQKRNTYVWRAPRQLQSSSDTAESPCRSLVSHHNAIKPMLVWRKKNRIKNTQTGNYIRNLETILLLAKCYSLHSHGLQIWARNAKCWPTYQELLTEVMSVMKAVENLSTCRVIEKEVKIEYIYAELFRLYLQDPNWS